MSSPRIRREQLISSRSLTIDSSPRGGACKRRRDAYGRYAAESETSCSRTRAVDSVGCKRKARPSWWPEAGIGPWKFFDKGAPAGLSVNGLGDEALPLMEAAIVAARTKLDTCVETVTVSPTVARLLASSLRAVDGPKKVKLEILAAVWEGLASCVSHRPSVTGDDRNEHANGSAMPPTHTSTAHTTRRMNAIATDAVVAVVDDLTRHIERLGSEEAIVQVALLRRIIRRAVQRVLRCRERNARLTLALNDLVMGDAHQQWTRAGLVRSLEGSRHIEKLNACLRRLPEAVADRIRKWRDSGDDRLEDLVSSVDDALRSAPIPPPTPPSDDADMSSASQAHVVSVLETYVPAALAIGIKTQSTPSRVFAMLCPDMMAPRPMPSLGSPEYAVLVDLRRVGARLDDLAQPQLFSNDLSDGIDRVPVPCARDAGPLYPRTLHYMANNEFHPSSGFLRNLRHSKFRPAMPCDGRHCRTAHLEAVFANSTRTGQKRLRYNKTGTALASDFIDTLNSHGGRWFGIVECNGACGCDPATCPNRLVQRGRKFSVGVFCPEGKGLGLRALEAIPAGSFVIEYVGEVLDNIEAERRGNEQDEQACSYLFDIGAGNNDDKGVFIIDGSKRGNAARFANHSCEPNMISIEVWIETDDSRLPHVAFFALRDIMPGEELTYDYNYGVTSDAPDDGAKRIRCHCGAPSCGGYLWG